MAIYAISLQIPSLSNHTNYSGKAYTPNLTQHSHTSEHMSSPFEVIKPLGQDTNSLLC